MPFNVPGLFGNQTVQKTLKGVLVSLFRIIIFGTIGREIRFFNLNMGLHHQSLFRHFK